MKLDQELGRQEIVTTPKGSMQIQVTKVVKVKKGLKSKIK